MERPANDVSRSLASWCGASGRLLVVGAVVALTSLVAMAGAPTVTDSEPAPTVVVIYASFRGFSPYEAFHSQLVSSLRENSSREVELHAEFLDVMVSRGEKYDSAVSEYLRQKYAGDRVVAVVGVSARGASLAKSVRDSVFPSASLVYGFLDRRVAETIDFGTNVTGTTGVVDIKGTTQFAVQLVPGTTHVAIVIGASDLERAWYARGTEEIHAAAPGVEVIALYGLPKDELIRRLATLPERTVVIWGTYYRDPQGGVYSPAELVADAAAASTAPIFGMFANDFGRGIVGGRIASYDVGGKATGRVLARLAEGEAAAVVPPIHVDENPLKVDWRALQRWHLDPTRLPQGVEVEFREPTVFEEYGAYVAVVAIVCALQAMLIVGLARQRSRRVRAQQGLAERLRFERLIADLSARFVDLPVDQIDRAISEGLEDIRNVFDADRVSLVQFEGDLVQARVVHSATAEGVAPLPEYVDVDGIRSVIEHVQRGESLQYDRPEDIPDRLSTVRETVVRRGVKAGVAVPLHSGGTTFGSLGITKLDRPRRWPSDASTRLRMLADIFANALVRKRGAAELHRSEALSTTVLRSIAAQICIVNRDGGIVAMNDAWRLAAGSSDGHLSCLFVGEHCPAEAGSPAPCAGTIMDRARSGVRAVIDGEQPSYSMEYRVATPTADSWYLLTVETLRDLGGGAVLSHQNITSRKRAELEAEQRRQELAHVSRVSTMGELAASIAHELNQPLTGVLTNAQAAMRFFARGSPNNEDMKEILRDIVDDGRRAGEVIRRLRAMLQTGAIEPADVDVNEVVSEVLKLLGSDAILRNVTIEFDGAAGLHRVRGDRIQLQQVVLNLVVNAMDAMRSVDAGDRRVTIATMASDPSTVLVSVSDRGPGIESDKLGRIFQPFFTTKGHGLGMGLSIARTIVEAHGGVLWAVNNPDCGASFLCRLPAVKESERVATSVVPGKVPTNRGAHGGD